MDHGYHQISIPGLIEYKIWSEDYRVGFQILWQNPEVTNGHPLVPRNGWTTTFETMSVCSHDFPELMSNFVCLRGSKVTNDLEISYRQVNSFISGQEYMAKVIAGIREWSDSDQAQNAIQRWLAVNSQVQQLDLFD